RNATAAFRDLAQLSKDRAVRAGQAWQTGGARPALRPAPGRVGRSRSLGPWRWLASHPSVHAKSVHAKSVRAKSVRAKVGTAHLFDVLLQHLANVLALAGNSGDHRIRVGLVHCRPFGEVVGGMRDRLLVEHGVLERREVLVLGGELGPQLDVGR